ncbi:MAG: ATP-binding protein [Muribaculaceae bacterium]|nr:ATP-binding protein [Muribaculaceae bacterium]
MLYRKIRKEIETHLQSDSDKILVIEGARQVGKSFIIRTVGRKMFKNFIEINFVEDDEGAQIFKKVRSPEEFYLALSMVAGSKLDNMKNTLIFIDEIQHYPQFLTMLKFLRQEHRYRYIASGSLLGITLRTTTSIPIGSIIRKKMTQLDFEEFLIANDFGEFAISSIKEKFQKKESLDEASHKRLMDLFKRYLLVGGMPDAVNEYLKSRNIVKVREVQNSIKSLYATDASKYEHDNGKNLLIRRIYDMLPSQMENKKKRIVAKNIQGQKGDRFNRYQDEFEYLVSSGIAININAISNPHYPLVESAQKNLLKLYLNDVGLLTAQLYHNNLQPILNDEKSINLGGVYENAVAQELNAHGYRLFYYDNRQKGEVDFLVDDYYNLTPLPIEVKSGKDYTIHSALNNLLSTKDYNIKSGVVLSNAREVRQVNNITYMPIYYVMFFNASSDDSENVFF